MTDVTPSKPMIIQGDGTILLEVESDFYSECRDWLSRFAELVKSPEHMHTYKITPIAIWNAAASGLKSQKVLEVLATFSKYPTSSKHSNRHTRLVLKVWKAQARKDDRREEK